MKAILLRVLLHLKCSNYSRHVFFGEFFMSTPALVNKADKLSTIKVGLFYNRFIMCLQNNGINDTCQINKRALCQA